MQLKDQAALTVGALAFRPLSSGSHLLTAGSPAALASPAKYSCQRHQQLIGKSLLTAGFPLIINAAESIQNI